MTNELAELLREASHELVRPRSQYARHLHDRLEAAAASLEAQEPVAFAHDGNLFWHGDPEKWRGVDMQLYRHPPTSAVPEGWKLVPVEPDYNMIKAADEKLTGKSGVLSIADAYQAMLAAAPMPESKGVQWYRDLKAAARQLGGGEDE